MNSKKMVRSGLSSRVNRMIMMGSHCRFHDYISYQGRECVIKVDERYTTKTCAKCMSIEEIGASKTFKCSKCLYVADRDVNSAVNILIKNTGRLSGLPLVDNANAYS